MLTHSPQNHITTATNKTYAFICAVLGCQALALSEGKASLTDEQLTALEGHISELSKKVKVKDDALASKAFYDDCALAHSRHRMNAVFYC